jgi:hypothetical protein
MKFGLVVFFCLGSCHPKKVEGLLRQNKDLSSGHDSLFEDVSEPSSQIAPLDVPSPIDALCSWNSPSKVGSDETFHSPPSFIIKTFYVSTADGNDLRTDEEAQNPATPWKTLLKVKESVDAWTQLDRKRVAVLFKRGETFSGGDVLFDFRQTNAPDELLYFGAYGSGPKPVLTGAVPLDSNLWESTNLNGHSVYRYHLPFFVPHQLWIDGQFQAAARWPRAGWATIPILVENVLNERLD